jgi:hypothetical protein
MEPLEPTSIPLHSNRPVTPASAGHMMLKILCNRVDGEGATPKPIG